MPKIRARSAALAILHFAATVLLTLGYIFFSTSRVEAEGESVGLNIQLPREQRINPYVKKARAFHYFFTRKVILAASAQAYVYFPGGFGTQDELFEILTLIQTKKSESVPVVLVGKEYWNEWYNWLENTVYGEFDAIERRDLEIFHIVDSAQEAFKIIRTSKERTFF